MTALQERASSAEKKKPKVPAEPGGLTASDILTGKVGLVVGVANEHSIAAGCAQAFRDAGAELVLTCREKSMPFVAPVAKEIHSRLLLPLDVETGERAPERRLVTIADVGGIAMGLVSDFARNVTGSIAYVDAGYHVMS